MKCDKETASLYLSDMLGEAERAGFERHLEECGECRAEVERYRRMITLLRGLPRAHAPANLRASVMRKAAAIEEKAAAGRSLRGLFGLPAFRAVAAVLVLAVGVGLAFYAYYSSQDMGLHVAERPAEHKADGVPPARGDEAGAFDTRSGRDVIPPAMLRDHIAGDGAVDGLPSARTLADMPGGVEPTVYYANIINVDRALENMSFDELNKLATGDHRALLRFAVVNSDPKFNEALAASPGDYNVYYQLTQKRVLVNALNKADSLDKVSTMMKAVAPAQVKEKALEPSEAEDAEGAEGEMEMGATAEIPEAESSDRNLRLEREARPMSYRYRFQRESGKDIVVFFLQELTLSPQAATGRKAVLDEETKADLKLVFDNLPTLENYSVEDFAKNGLVVTLSEEEFLRLLKYIRDVGGIRAELGPVQAKLKIEEMKDMKGGMAEKKREIRDPYAVDLRIEVLGE